MNPAPSSTPSPPTTVARTFALVGAGGAIGSLLRHGALSTSVDPSVMVVVLNVLGSLALGGLTAWIQHDHAAPPTGLPSREQWVLLLGLGACGGLTTFSTHMVDVAERLGSTPGAAALSLAGTALLAVSAASIGFGVLRSVLLADPNARGNR